MDRNSVPHRPNLPPRVNSHRPSGEPPTAQQKGLSIGTAGCQCVRPVRCSNSLSQEFGVQMRKGALLETPFPALLPVAPGTQTEQEIHTGIQSSPPSHKATRASGHHALTLSHSLLHTAALSSLASAVWGFVSCSEVKQPLGGDTGLNSVPLGVTSGILPSLPRALESVPTVAGSQKHQHSFPTLPGMLLGVCPPQRPWF